jgi:fatty-acyl-CoA synthase
LRFQSEIDMTSTFKQRKLDLVADGFDPERVPNGVFFRESERNNFVRLDAALYGRIISGALKL